MATKTKKKSNLEIMKEEQVELQSRLARAKDTHDQIQAQLKDLESRRLDPSASEDRNAPGLIVGLKATLADKADAIASLEHVVEERGKLVAQLEHAAAKEDVAFQCRVAEAHFQQVMDALAGHLPEMRGWLVDASTAHSRYASVNRSQNETLKQKMAILGYLVEYISNQPRRYL